ncbi:MAG: hypothetical protein ACREO0_15125 [Pseudoxanthomonas sp.]
MIDNFYVGFAACAVVMTLFPAIAVKINGAVRSAIKWVADVRAELRAAKKGSKP